MGFLKPKAATSTSTSENVNNGLISSAYGGQMNTGTGATNFLAQLLGVTPGAVSSTASTIGNAANRIAEGGGAQQGYQNYLQMAGYEPALATMQRGVTGGAAARGILNSGATAKALQDRGAEINQGYFNNYLQQLSGLSGLGLQAGGLIANTGQKSTGTNTGSSPSTLGSIASTIGGIASIFSDRRLKRNIRKIDECADGMGIYEFRYVWSPLKVVGVMAQEVERLRPWALGPRRFGFMTVNYGAL